MTTTKKNITTPENGLTPSTYIYQPYERPARVNGLPLIGRADLDCLADELLRHPLDETIEEVFLIARHKYSWSSMLFSTDNQALHHGHTVKDHFVVHVEDAEWLTRKRFDLLGCVHTHRHRSGNDRPSQDDLEGLGVGYIGGVWMHGGDTVYWYGMGRVFHETNVLRPVLIRMAERQAGL